MANIAQSGVKSDQTTSCRGRPAPLGRQMGADPADDLLAVAGIDHHDVERLAVVVVVVADQDVVEDAAVLVGHQRVADLAQAQVGHAAGERFGQEDGRPGPLEPQPAHVRDVGQADGLSRGVVLLDDRGVLDRHRPAGEVDHSGAVGDVPIVKRRPRRCVGHGVHSPRFCGYDYSSRLRSLRQGSLLECGDLSPLFHEVHRQRTVRRLAQTTRAPFLASAERKRR